MKKFRNPAATTKRLLPIIFLMLLACFSTSCALLNDQPNETAVQDDTQIGQSVEGEPAEIILMTHDSFAISEAVLNEFEVENGVKVIILPAGDTGAALNQAILSKTDPLADVFFGVDNSFMSRALDEDIFLSYQSLALENISDSLKLDDTFRLLPVDFGDVCLNYDIEWFESRGIEPPQSLTDLILPIYENTVVVENPATSSPGLAFMLATISEFGLEGDFTYLDFWREMRNNGVMVTDGWEDAYYGQFSATGSGARPIVVSYASSPPAEVVFSEPPLEEPPTATITSPGSCFRQVEFIGILKGTENQPLAEKLIDFMLAQTFQEDIPLNMFVFPSNTKAQLPQVFVDWAAIPEEPATVAPEQIEANREMWIESWTEAVLR
jgi:thiamine transport system substrate-binding protein